MQIMNEGAGHYDQPLQFNEFSIVELVQLIHESRIMRNPKALF